MVPEPPPIPIILIDTSFLSGTDLGSADIQKLLRKSQIGEIKVCVPHIAWEERRTQWLEEANKRVNDLREAERRIRAPQRGNLVCQALKLPDIEIWSNEQLEDMSHAAMAEFAGEFKVHVLPIAADHAERAWGNYFKVGAPYNPSQDRQTRRRDIPDAWILEAARDLIKSGNKVSSLCRDGNLSSAMSTIGISVFSEVESLLLSFSGPTAKAGDQDQSPEVTLAAKRVELEKRDSIVLGFSAYLSGPSKEELFHELEKVGISEASARNSAERLCFLGMLTDTGNFYLPVNNEVVRSAAKAVESEIIAMMKF